MHRSYGQVNEVIPSNENFSRVILFYVYKWIPGDLAKFMRLKDYEVKAGKYSNRSFTYGLNEVRSVCKYFSAWIE